LLKNKKYNKIKENILNNKIMLEDKNSPEYWEQMLAKD
jgi:hypothetical protein